ncbi:coronatine-insensitive protein 1-like protein [Tanacetum coccineum]
MDKNGRRRTETVEIGRKRSKSIENGYPRAILFSLESFKWGGYVTPWVEEIAEKLKWLECVRFGRMLVRDKDLELSFIIEIDGEWLHELALRNKCIESFNHYLTPFYKFDYADLALLAKNCRESLVSLKIKGCPRKYVAEVFSYAVNLEEFGGDPYIDEGEEDIGVKFPPKMRRVTWRKGNILDITIIRNFGHQLTKLDLRYSRFGSDEHCYLIQKCPNLEELYTNNAIGDV